jgi:hypothetical protein
MMEADPLDAGLDEREAEEADGDAYPPGVPTPRDLPDIADISEPHVISAAEGGRIDDGRRPNPLLDLDLLPDETDDPNVAAQQGLPWVPPSDPPTAGFEPDGDPLVAVGFGSTALDEPYDADHHRDALPDEEEVNSRVREALRADAATTAYADRVAIAVVGDTAILTGTVDDVDDIIAVAGRPTGLAEIVDRLGVAAVDASRDPRGSEGA